MNYKYENDIIILKKRLYLTTEVPKITGIPKSTLNRILQPHREKIGKRITGNRWHFAQLIMILDICDTAYKIAA